MNSGMVTTVNKWRYPISQLTIVCVYVCMCVYVCDVCVYVCVHVCVWCVCVCMCVCGKSSYSLILCTITTVLMLFNILLRNCSFYSLNCIYAFHPHFLSLFYSLSLHIWLLSFLISCYLFIYFLLQKLFIYFYLLIYLLFICAYNAWVISPPVHIFSSSIFYNDLEGRCHVFDSTLNFKK
jgi:hypothetical protein